MHSKLGYIYVDAYKISGIGERNCGIINYYLIIIGIYNSLKGWKSIAVDLLAYTFNLLNANHSVIFGISWLTILTREFR